MAYGTIGCVKCSTGLSRKMFPKSLSSLWDSDVHEHVEITKQEVISHKHSSLEDDQYCRKSKDMLVCATRTVGRTLHSDK